MAIKIALGIIGGLGLFLYGMNLMGSGLQKAAGEKLKKTIELLTSNRFMGVLVGTLVTAIIQSSSATTVMVVGFVNAGIMKLTQAVGVIMGANIGTTVTAQLVSFKLTDMAPVAVGIGMIIYLFSSKEKNKQIAEILIGFGILFIGMDFMKHAVKPLREVPAFTNMLVSFGHNPFLGILMGFGLTVIVQSSSASMGILLALASEGLMPLSSALPILYGENIGTCVTALLSSIGASKNAKRAAIMHLTFNIIGTTLFAFVLTNPITSLVTKLNPVDVTRQIANAHTFFNIINVIIQFPFAMLLVKIAMTIIPEKDDEVVEHKLTKYIDERILETPSIAVANTIRESLRMGKKAGESFESAMNGFFNKSKKSVYETFEKERIVNDLEKAIMEYIIKLSNKSVSVGNREIVDGLFHTINDIERVGDHADNIAELAMEVIEKDLPFSDSALEDLKVMFDKVMNAYKYSLKAMKNGDRNLAFNVIKLEEQIDEMEKSYRKNHIYRLNNNICNTESGIIYLDLISNMERIGDHASNIAKAVIDASTNKIN
ncbi:Na/Pi cotransporter family protein [Tepidibacter formicigenes]|jgi:phosphate:Na+ symporter|uniref:Phosphate:Na+ symporter n=1 Tax=Tepidibacter formicigenes DSM 15518 TaxID=1123349 RepID=A0A1M6N5W7_9FIRM|nr:Na/Pi cotransporter family protein [Tepidibacter formicigenes]SHJ91125.1 phosphate:Na+ symporter [Tepidibacter formicigenes DSM 15518]